MKKTIIISITILMIFTLFACEKEEVENTETTTKIIKETADKQWPETELTSLVAKPDFGVLNGAVEIEDEFCVSINESQIVDVRAYVEQVKQLGFVEKQDTIDKEAMGIEVYSYTAETLSGYKISIEYTSSVCSITLSKVQV